MLAFVSIVVLIVELVVCAAIGLPLVARLGWPLWTVAPLIVVLILVFWLLLVSRTFVASKRFTSEDKATRRIGFAGWCRLIVREWLSEVLLYNVVHPLSKWLNRPNPPASTTGIPVLLVHGLICNGSAWNWMRRALGRQGINRCYQIDLEPVFANIDHYAQELAEHVEHICAETGSPKVLLVAHSMGGLISRSYLHKCDGAKRVAGLITLGTPHHGTALATVPMGENIRQMQLNDPWLAELNKSETQPPPVPISSLYSAHDNLVSPQASSRLAYAENIRLIGIGHVALLFSKEVADLVGAFIKRNSDSSRL